MEDPVVSVPYIRRLHAAAVLIQNREKQFFDFCVVRLHIPEGAEVFRRLSGPGIRILRQRCGFRYQVQQGLILLSEELQRMMDDQLFFHGIPPHSSIFRSSSVASR